MPPTFMATITGALQLDENISPSLGFRQQFKTTLPPAHDLAIHGVSDGSISPINTQIEHYATSQAAMLIVDSVVHINGSFVVRQVAEPDCSGGLRLDIRTFRADDFPGNPDDPTYMDRIPSPEPPFVTVIGLAGHGTTPSPFDDNYRRYFDLRTSVFDALAPAPSRTTTFTVRCFIPSTQRWSNFVMPQPNSTVSVYGTIVGLVLADPSDTTSVSLLAISVDTIAYLGTGRPERPANGAQSPASSSGPPTTPRKRRWIDRPGSQSGSSRASQSSVTASQDASSTSSSGATEPVGVAFTDSQLASKDDPLLGRSNTMLLEYIASLGSTNLHLCEFHNIRIGRVYNTISCKYYCTESY
ncbi:hypothetical protein BJ508DRAFT_415587 [Ascobolus immersus RN42]|uniref:Uncharacterized protein n=1 Tax=Ascobolus immersus RN42 TaxID=1160509 RepID=A0A3N4I7G2_ASCIM|nr:hypothetical protein BJ508DRAFT_415587 [Ascobolus immersus RN42]